MPEDSKSRVSSETLGKCSNTSEDVTSWEAKVRQYSLRSAAEHFCSGNHLDRFAKFLGDVDREADSRSEQPQTCYAMLYDFQRSDPRIELHSPSDLSSLKKTNAAATSQSQLLLLRGYPSRAFLLAVGDTFDVDVECLHRHLEAFSKNSVETAWVNPPLASQAIMQPRLRLTTLGHLHNPGEHTREVKHVRKLRKHAADVYSKYHRLVRQEHDSVRRGISLLRGISVHSAGHFSFAQDVSTWTKKTEKGWFALAFLDVGQYDLAEGPEGDSLLAPLGGQSNNTVFGPTVFGQASDASYTGDDRPPTYQRSECIVQNAMHLWKEYDRGLNMNLARQDAFYALSKLFAFAAASEKQFLNMIRHVVSDDIAQSHVFNRDDNRDDASLSNLPYNQQILNEHMQHLKGNVAAIERRGRLPRLPGIGQMDQDALEQVGNRLLEDYQDLLQRARDLADECDRGVRNAMNLASHTEARKGIAQAERVEWLTRLAFVFIPMSFTASFFGMNFQEFGQGHVHLWTWFALTGPVFLVSLILMITKLRRRILRWLGAWYRHMRGLEHDQDIEMQEVNAVV